MCIRGSRPNLVIHYYCCKMGRQNLWPCKKKLVDHPFCFKEVGRAGGVFFFITGMNVVVKTKISYILERVFN